VLEAALWGLVTAGSLWVGWAIAVGQPGRRWIGLAMAFGAGVLIASVAYELVLEAFDTDLYYATAGFAAGALAFYTGDSLIDRRGGHGRKSTSGDDQLAGSANAIVLGTILDGIPESFVLGASLLKDGAVPIAAAAVGWLALNRLPEADGAFVLAFAGGALIVMLADTLMPEAFELGGREAGLLTALGFAVGFGLS
jgi:ZIP family zinc transporter